MLSREVKASLINLAIEAEFENYNVYWTQGLIKFLNLFDARNERQRKKIMKFLKETNQLTRKLYLELCYVCG
jgi:hypothetical protein